LIIFAWKYRILLHRIFQLRFGLPPEPKGNRDKSEAALSQREVSSLENKYRKQIQSLHSQLRDVEMAKTQLESELEKKSKLLARRQHEIVARAEMVEKKDQVTMTAGTAVFDRLPQILDTGNFRMNFFKTFWHLPTPNPSEFTTVKYSVNDFQKSAEVP